MKRGILLSNTALAMAAQLLTRGAIFLAGLVVANRLGQNAFAAYSYLSITANAISVICAFGLGVSVLRQFALPLGSLRDFDIAESRVLGFAVAICVIAPLVVIPLIPSSWLALPESASLSSLAILTSSTVGVGLVISGLHGLERFRLVAQASSGSALFIVGGAVIAAVADNEQIANWSLILSNVLVLALIGPAWFRRAFLTGDRSIDSKCYRSSLPIVLRNSVVIVTTSACVSSGLWMAGRTTLIDLDGINQVQFALFGAGFQWFSLILLVPNVVTRVYQPAVVRYSIGVGNASVEPRSPVAANLRIAAGAAFLSFSIVALFSQAAEFIYGNEFPNIANVVVVYSLAGAIAAPVTALGAAFLSTGKNALWLLLMVFWLVMLATGLFILSKQGAIGVGWAITFAYATTIWPAIVVAKRCGVLSPSGISLRERS